MKKIRAVFADMDGTLLDTIGDLTDSMNRILDGLGVEGYTVPEYKLMVGNGVRALVERAVTGRGIELEEVHVNDFVFDYNENCVVKTVPYPGIIRLLDELDGRNIPVGVVTNKAEEIAWSVTKSVFGSERFAFFRGGRDDIPLKPDPAGTLIEAEKLGVDPREIIFLGDSGVDMKTAVRAGMYPCGVGWGFRSVEELKEAGAEKIIDDPVDLLKMMD